MNTLKFPLFTASLLALATLPLGAATPKPAMTGTEKAVAATPAPADSSAATEAPALPVKPDATKVPMKAEAPMPAAEPSAAAKMKAAQADKMVLGDGEVIALLNTINENEILAATAAEKKKIKEDVMDFARMMQKEHGKNMEDTLKLSKKIEVKPVETDAVAKMKAKGAAELKELVKMDGDAFAAAYVTSQVKGHEEALEAIDGKLLPHAEHADLKKHLTETREHVAMHLDHARKLQGGAAAKVSHAEMPAVPKTK